MELPEKDWYNVYEVASRWNTDHDRIEHYLEIGKLKASIKLNGAIFQIENYIDIEWKYSWQAGASFCKLSECRIKVSQKGKDVEYFKDNSTISIDDILITLENIKAFEAESDKESPAKKPDYMNSDHPHFSKELCDAVTAWTVTAKKNPDPARFKAIAREWLSECADYQGNALDRLSAVVNSEKGKKGGVPKKDL